MSLPLHRQQALLRAMHYWNRRIENAIVAGRLLTDPQVIAWSHALDRCIVAWHSLERDSEAESELVGVCSDPKAREF